MERQSAENGIHLCATCHRMIDKNGGGDFRLEVLRDWKREREERTAEQLGASAEGGLTHLAGEHSARGIGEVIGVDARGPVRFDPGTRSQAEGIGAIIGTRIGGGG